MEPFWTRKKLHELNTEEWEAVCDGCGRCCLHKLQDEETDEVFYTRVACRLLDLTTCRCRYYRARHHLVSDCVVLRPDNLEVLQWMPSSCAYRLLAEGKPFPDWHPLLNPDVAAASKAGFSVQAFALSEDDLDQPEELENHVIPWPK